LAVPTIAVPDPLATDAPDDGMYDAGWMVFGWSHGYVAFDQITTTKDDESWTSVVYTSSSKDGLHWQAGSELKLAGRSADGSPGLFEELDGVVEGPAGLVLVDSGGPPCGSLSEWPFAISRDGITWTPIRNAIHDGQLTGGATGYIMTGPTGIFTSTDGSTWHSANLKSAAFKGLDVLETGVAFADGFVVSGDTTVDLGCSGTPDFRVPALWWSPDGKTWSRDVVPDAPAAPDAAISVCRYSDRLLVAHSIALGSSFDWVSTDGRTWRRLPTAEVNLCPRYYPDSILTTIAGTLILSNTDADSTSIYTLQDDFTLAKLAQTGDVPADGHSGSVFGPAGLIVVGNDGNTYVGVPTAG
jgi:hypothetical protein